MNNQPENNIKVAHHSWWILGLVGFFIGLASEDHHVIPRALFAWGGNGAFLGWILGLIIDSIRKSKAMKVLHNKVNEAKEQRRTNQLTKAALEEYQDAKNRFQYLSAETLKEKYKAYTTMEETDMIRLALEEELVRRGIIEYSPMHEKIENIRKKHL
jgi:hypothetical protein